MILKSSYAECRCTWVGGFSLNLHLLLLPLTSERHGVLQQMTVFIFKAISFCFTHLFYKDGIKAIDHVDVCIIRKLEYIYV